MSDLRDDPTSPPVLSSERVFDGRVWDVRRETFELGDATILRDFVDHPGAVEIEHEDRARGQGVVAVATSDLVAVVRHGQGIEFAIELGGDVDVVDEFVIALPVLVDV